MQPPHGNGEPQIRALTAAAFSRLRAVQCQHASPALGIAGSGKTSRDEVLPACAHVFLWRSIKRPRWRCLHDCGPDVHQSCCGKCVHKVMPGKM